MSSMVCPECQSEIPSGSEYCPECGYPFESASPPKCPICGTDMPDDAGECPHCVQTISQAPATTPEVSESSPVLPPPQIESGAAVAVSTDSSDDGVSKLAAKIDLINDRLLGFESILARLSTDLQEIKHQSTPQENALTVADINKGTESCLKPVTEKLGILPELAKKISAISPTSEEPPSMFVKWQDYILIAILIILVFLILNIFITAYIVRVMPG